MEDLKSKEIIIEENGYILKRIKNTYYIYLGKSIITSFNKKTSKMQAIRGLKELAKEEGKTITFNNIKIKKEGD